MGGAGVLGAQTGHHLLGAGTIGHRLHAGDEAALLDEQFVVDRGKDGLGHKAAGSETGNGNNNANPKVGVVVESLVGRAGFEPATNGLKVRCSTS